MCYQTIGDSLYVSDVATFNMGFSLNVKKISVGTYRYGVMVMCSGQWITNFRAKIKNQLFLLGKCQAWSSSVYLKLRKTICYETGGKVPFFMVKMFVKCLFGNSKIRLAVKLKLGGPEKGRVFMFVWIIYPPKP